MGHHQAITLVDEVGESFSLTISYPGAIIYESKKLEMVYDKEI